MMNDRYTLAIVIPLGIMYVLVVSCNHPHWHTSDAILRRNFDTREAAFVALRDMALEDSSFLTISTKYVITRTQTAYSPPANLDLVGMSKERYSKYLALFHTVGLEWVGRGDKGEVTFRLDSPSFWNAASEKGYLYSPVELPSVSDLDSYVPPRRDRPWTVYSRLKSQWYLYLAVG